MSHREFKKKWIFEETGHLKKSKVVGDSGKKHKNQQKNTYILKNEIWEIRPHLQNKDNNDNKNNNNDDKDNNNDNNNGNNKHDAEIMAWQLRCENYEVTILMCKIWGGNQRRRIHLARKLPSRGHNRAFMT